MRLENTEACKARIMLALLKGIPRARLIEILETAGSPERLFSPELERVSKNLSPDEMSALVQGRPDDLDEQLRLAGPAGSEIVSWTDEDYPSLLKHIQYAPPVVFFKGYITIASQPAVAIVGSRACSPSGRYVAERLARDIAARGFVVVSGLARGIDSAAHRGALAAGGLTIAVLGCGVDICYPPENRKLLKEILVRGAVVSEFLLGTPPLKQNFPLRNRLISGMSQAVVVVEAGEGSGALVTAGYALEQGREVFVVPGDTTLTSTVGSNRLLKEGARPITDAEDVFDELLPRLGDGPQAIPQAQPFLEVLSGEEEAVLECLSLVPAHVDEVCDRLGRGSSVILSLLLSLELKGFVRQETGNRFVRSNV
ncbi:MAG: DNA-processing protein DprA [Candidatus Eisenbacteria bacterium]|nr:DNA-processing protein DprA [Candidatus Eisenbacteria bacterium]